ncbi:hypothetical protein N2152v2_006238 [Parachlorella kessleri]
MTDSNKKRKLFESTANSAAVIMGGQDTKTEAAALKARKAVSVLTAINAPLEELPLAKKGVKALLDVCKNEDNLDAAAQEGAVGAVVPLLNALSGGGGDGVEELERDICFILGLLAIKVDHQTAICKHGALPTLVAMIKRYSGKNDIHLTGIPAQTCRRTADAITNLAHENNDIKNKVRQEGGVPPLVSLLHSIDPKVQRAVAGSLRTLAFKNEDNKQIIVELGSLPLLIQMLRAEDSTIHYEAVGVIGNLVHSSPAIKRRVLEEGALQPVINLLSSPCADSQREAALLLGQFATADGDYKLKIVQRGAVPPLVDMLGNSDPQLREMAAFALGRLAQNPDNQAGVVACGGLLPLIDLLESRQGNLQHNAAFALYGLSDNEDNLIEFVREGAVQRIKECELIVQASKDCVEKTVKRLRDKLKERTLGQILYLMQGSAVPVKQRIAVALCHLTSPDTPGNNLQLMYMDKKGLDVLLDMVTDPHVVGELQKQAAGAIFDVAQHINAAAPLDVGPLPPNQQVLLGSKYVNSQTLSDVTFIVEGRAFYAHRIALLASSEIFQSMFDGGYREKSANSIPIPNIRYEVFEAMMHCIYTGHVDVTAELAQELLEAADQYMLDNLKRLCEIKIAEELQPDNVSVAFDLAENFNAQELSKRCALFCLEKYKDMLELGVKSPAAYAVLLQKMAPRLKESLEEAIAAKVSGNPPPEFPIPAQ